MHSGSHHNQCTDYKSFAKRNILHQFKPLISSLPTGYLPIFSPIVAWGFWGGGRNFCLRRCRSPWPSRGCGPALIAYFLPSRFRDFLLQTQRRNLLNFAETVCSKMNKLCCIFARQSQQKIKLSDSFQSKS